MIQNEDAKAASKSSESDAPEDSDSALSSADDSAESDDHVFGKSKEKKRKAPTVAKAPKKAPPRKPAPVAGAVPGTPVALSVVKRWFKEMDGTAAQQPPSPSSNPTGNLRLSQEAFAIDHKKYFREVFFNVAVLSIVLLVAAAGTALGSTLPIAAGTALGGLLGIALGVVLAVGVYRLRHPRAGR